MTVRDKTARGNRDYPWDEFSPEDYFKYNYIELRDDDRQIVEWVSDFFVETFSASPRPAGIRGIDVGTGSNLYPALTMLPFCETVTLFEHSTPNVRWLSEEREQGWPSWDNAWRQFWALLRDKGPYRDISNPRAELSGRVRVKQGDVLTVPDEGPWDVGTMFFVAESITGQRGEFLAAVDHFFAMLKANAPFAMAFMEHSAGYHVGRQDYPATDIGTSDVSECLKDRAVEVEIRQLGPGNKPLREHYTGMIVACGRVKHVA